MISNPHVASRVPLRDKECRGSRRSAITRRTVCSAVRPVKLQGTRRREPAETSADVMQATRPPRVYAVSDVHTDHEANLCALMRALNPLRFQRHRLIC